MECRAAKTGYSHSRLKRLDVNVIIRFSDHTLVGCLFFNKVINQTFLRALCVPEGEETSTRGGERLQGPGSDPLEAVR